MPDRFDQVECKQHMRIMLDFAYDENNTELDRNQALLFWFFISNDTKNLVHPPISPSPDQ